MKAFISIFCLVILVSAQTPIGQLFKLPLLVEHFIKHQRAEGVSFIGFLVTHYSSDHQDADLPEDEELPFKNIGFNPVGFALVPMTVKTRMLLPAFIDKVVLLNEHYVPQQYKGSIFHPPRT